jgi:AcrR family transcriptional regulator
MNTSKLKLITKNYEIEDLRIDQLQTKGELTKTLILDSALYLAGRDGFEGLTIGLIADRMQMSKSGVYAHFDSKENLQLEVINEYHRRFKESIFDPAMTMPRGMPRLKMLLDLWIKITISEINTGCIYISGAMELDDRPGPVRDELAKIVQDWRNAIIKAIKMAVTEGHLKKDVNPRELLFAFYGAILCLQHDARFLRDKESIQTAKKYIKKIIAAHCP